jgi:hypothetical protein
MAIEIKFLIDGLDRGQPLNPEDFGFSINEDDSIGSRVVSFNNDLFFDGTAYQYLFDKVIDRTFCQLISVQVQYRCQNSWERLVDGYIVVTETVFDLDRCRAKTKLYDESFSTKINNNKGIPFSLSAVITKNLEPIVPPARRLIKLFNPASPIGTFDAGRGVTVFDALTHLISCMSDNLVDFASDFFFAEPDQSNIVCITNGRSIRTNQDIEIVVTFEQLYRDLRAKYNLGIGFFKQANNRPVIRIEPIEYFYQLNQSASLIDQPDIDFRFDTQKIYAAVQFGNSPVLEANESNSQNDPPQSLTFIQTPFRGFRKERFGFTGECNTSNILNVETTEIIFDTNVIEDIIRFNNESHDLSNIILQVDYNGGVTPFFNTRRYDPYGIGQDVFNGGFTNDEVSLRWINGFPNSLFSFLQEGFNPIDTFIESRISNDSQTWEVTNNVPILFSTFNGDYVEFNTEITDPNNYFSGDEYRVPYAGLYTITSELIYGFLEPFNGGFNRRARLRFAQFDSTDNFITDVYGTLFGDSGSTDVIITGSGQFVCNQGDILRVDAEVNYLNVSTATNMTQRLLATIVLSGENRFSFVTIEGIPFDNEELVAVNVEDLRSFLYEFERPLSMNEITSIINQTSSPIELGRTEDSLAVIDGYIKTMEVQSVIRQNAKFVLKSNEILR